MSKTKNTHSSTSISNKFGSFGLIMIIGLVLTGAYAAWFLHRFEKVTVTSTEPTKAAKNNQFLVAELMLNNLKVPASTEFGRDKLVTLPSEKDVLIVNEIGSSFNQKRIDTMIDWMENGGRIITFIDRRIRFADNEGKDHQGNRLLNHFEIYGLGNDYKSYDNEEVDTDETDLDQASTGKTNSDQVNTKKTSHIDSDAKPHKNRDAVHATLEGVDASVFFDKTLGLDYYPDNETEGDGIFLVGHPVKQILESDMTVHMLRLQVGKGELIALSSRDFLTNPEFDFDRTVVRKKSETKQNEQANNNEESSKNGTSPKDDINDLDDLADIIASFKGSKVTSINEGDNAYFLTYLTQGAAHVWLLPSIDAPSFWQILWQKARYACMAFLILSFAWLLWQMGRFGPIKPLVETSRRSILEHLQAQANYFWRIDKAQKLLAQNRVVVKQSLLDKHPSLKGLNSGNLCEKLSKSIPLTSEQIHNALYHIPKNESQFIANSIDLKKLYEHL